jgi:hypothetical protein
MTDLVNFVMQAAATELLQAEADQIDQEVQRFLSEMERAPFEECRAGSFAQRFLELLKRRGEVARKALILFEEPQSERPCAPDPIKWVKADFGFLGKHQRGDRGNRYRHDALLDQLPIPAPLSRLAHSTAPARWAPSRGAP